MPQSTLIARLAGGLDVVTPAMQLENGRAIDGFNYEPDVAGYRRFQGYERLDGRDRPCLASYTILRVVESDLSGFTAGSTVTGATSSATGTILDVTITDNGIAVSEVSGTFTAGETLNVGGSPEGTLDGEAMFEGEPDVSLHRAALAAAASARRAAITAVPGSGAVRGVVGYAGDIYAFRDNAGGTACVMHKATGSGWSAVDLGSRLHFDTGTAAFVEGSTVTGVTSGATGTIERVSLSSGTWAGGDAAGILTLSGTSGIFVDGETLNDGGGSPHASADGAEIVNTLPAGGRYEFVVHNFFGAASSRRLYGVNGAGRAFEFDGTVFAFIGTGLDTATDTPRHIAEHKGHLFLGYDAGSWLHSGTGLPLSFVSTDGAGEIALGDEPMGAVRAGSVLVLTSKRRVDYLQGSSSSDFVLQPISHDSGAVRYSLEATDTVLYMDDGAIRALTTTEALGGWRMGALSQLIEPVLTRYREAGTTVRASMRVRARDLYRVFFSDGTALSVYLGREAPEIMPLRLPITVNCAWSGRELGDADRMLVGCDDGFVYETDVGRDFDGDALDAMLRTNFMAPGNPQQQHRFHKAVLEFEGPPAPTLQVAPETDYGNAYNPAESTLAFEITEGGAFWASDYWGEFTWNAQVVGEGEAYLNTLGRSLSLALTTEATTEPPHTLSMLTVYHSPRRLSR